MSDVIVFGESMKVTGVEVDGEIFRSVNEILNRLQVTRAPQARMHLMAALNLFIDHDPTSEMLNHIKDKLDGIAIVQKINGKYIVKLKGIDGTEETFRSKEEVKESGIKFRIIETE